MGFKRESVPFTYGARRMNDLNTDLLEGAEAIAAFLGMSQRRVFYLAEHRRLPVFKIGNKLNARKSTLLRHIEQLEREAMAS